VEQDYNRKRHSEINDTPLARFLAGPSVTRPCPDAAALRLAFTRTERRTLRKSDGTAVIEGRRLALVHSTDPRAGCTQTQTAMR
jgi:hypothetical protein